MVDKSMSVDDNVHMRGSHKTSHENIHPILD